MDGLDKTIRNRIMKFTGKMIDSRENPRRSGKPLAGRLSDLWSYRVGDYRIIAKIKDDQFVILAVHVGHRRNVYDFVPE